MSLVGLVIENSSSDSAAHPSSLVNTATTARGFTASSTDDYNTIRRRKRGFQRAMSGLGRHPGEWWRYVFITLTSGPESPADIQASWRRLHERMRRRHWAGRYIRVVEKGSNTGMVHIHLITEADWIPISWIRRNWQEIHGAEVVDIRRVARTGKTGWSVGIAAELAGYLAKCPINRMSYSRKWAWPALARTWKVWCRAARIAGLDFTSTLLVWQRCCRKGVPPPADAGARWMVSRSPIALGILWLDPASEGG